MKYNLGQYFSKAASYLKNSRRLNSLLWEASTKMKENPSVKDKVFGVFEVFKRMLQAYLRGEYKVVPWKSLLMMMAAILYFVNPLDLVPDFIPVTGLVDDVTVLIYVYRFIKDDIEAFLAWEEASSMQDLSLN